MLKNVTSRGTHRPPGAPADADGPIVSRDPDASFGTVHRARPRETPAWPRETDPGPRARDIRIRADAEPLAGSGDDRRSPRGAGRRARAARVGPFAAHKIDKIHTLCCVCVGLRVHSDLRLSRMCDHSRVDSAQWRSGVRVRALGTYGLDSRHVKSSRGDMTRGRPHTTHATSALRRRTDNPRVFCLAQL